MRSITSTRSLCFALLMMLLSVASFGQISISVSYAPPALPEYEQPLVPGDGYLWVPGYWAYADDDYYWVPGTWVMPPEPGLLWTPGYWSWSDSGYAFNDGYWAQSVGFYGGISYGYGYFGQGYEGGRWQGGQFYYNRSVNNVNVTSVHNIYNTPVNNSSAVRRVSYNGGDGGITARPRPEEQAASRERHIPPVAAQTQHVQAARGDSELRASANHGKPPVAATPKPGAFKDRAVVPAKAAGAPYKPPTTRATQPAANAPARSENGVPRPDRAATSNQPESKGAPPNRSPSAEPSNRPERNHSTAEPNKRPEAERAPVTEPNRSEPRSSEPAQRPQTSTPSDRSQPQHTPPETPRAAQPQQRSRPQTPEEKKSNEKPKEDKRPPQ